MGLKILLVDRNATYVARVRELVEGDCHQLLHVRDLPAARKCLEQRPDMMVIAKPIADEDNFELIRQARICYPGTIIVIKVAPELDPRTHNDLILSGAHYVHIRGGTQLMRLIAEIAEARQPARLGG